MALVTTLDLTNYLQAATEPARYSKNKCSLAYSRSSADLLRTVSADTLTASSYRNILRPRLDDGSLRSRSAVYSAAGRSGFPNNSLEEEISFSSSSTSTSVLPRSTRKRVWFADEIGRDLVTISRYEVPSPTPTVDDRRPTCHRRLRLESAFRQPWLDPAALRCRVDSDTIALESVSSRGLSLAGTVLVANVAFEKRVTVRCTFNDWRSFVDVAAGYVTGGIPGTDLFAFQVQPDWTSMIGDERPPRRVEFAVRYQYRAQSDDDWTERWDNNTGRNYQMIVIC